MARSLHSSFIAARRRVIVRRLLAGLSPACITPSFDAHLKDRRDDLGCKVPCVVLSGCRCAQWASAQVNYRLD